ncbi:aminopeptidase N-like [Ooceraea biroi]|nr:aminopeptidase N-like [Ooceraea biroi]
MTGTKYNGETNITIKIEYGTQYITLHAHRLKIFEEETKLFNHKDDTILWPMDHVYRHSQVLILFFHETLKRGIYTLHFKYNGDCSEEGAGLVKLPDTNIKSNNSNWMIVSQFDKIGARQAFPCWDEPKLKATFNITVTHHLQHWIFSTMPIREEKHDDINFSLEALSHFEKTPKMSTYLLGITVIAVGRCGCLLDNIFRTWCRENLNVTNSFLEDMGHRFRRVASHLTQYTNTSMKLPKLDIIIVPDYVPNISSSWGMLLLKESWITAKINESQEFNEIQKVNLTGFMAHEMAKQWFNHIFGPTWSDTWLNDGLVLYFKAYILGQMYKEVYEERMMDFIALGLQKSLHLDDIRSRKNELFYTESSYETDLIEPFLVADKTLILLHMLKSLVTVETFWEGIKTYLNTYQFLSATPESFYNAIQSVLNKKNVKVNFEVKEVMHIWLNQTTYSLVNVRRNYKDNEARISTNDAEEHKRTWIPLTFATKTLDDFSNTMPTQWLKYDMTFSTTLAQCDWIIYNLQQSGYYRVKYDATNWEKIAAYLNSNKFKKIHAINRAQIIDDAYYFLVEKQLDCFTFFHITFYLAKEVNYTAWFPMFRILSYLWKFFLLPFKEPLILEAVKTHILGILNGLLTNIGYDDNDADDDITLLMRGTALKWACRFGDPSCKEMASRKLKRLLNDTWDDLISFRNRTVLPREEWIICNALKGAEIRILNNVWHLYIKTRQNVILELLTCFEHPKVVIECISLLDAEGTQLKKITDNQHSHIFDMLIRKYAHNAEVLDYILQRFKIVKPRSYSKSRLVKEIISNVYSEEQLIKTYNVFKQDTEVSENLTTMINARSIQLQDMMTSFLEMFT